MHVFELELRWGDSVHCRFAGSAALPLRWHTSQRPWRGRGPQDQPPASFCALCKTPPLRFPAWYSPLEAGSRPAAPDKRHAWTELLQRRRTRGHAPASPVRGCASRKDVVLTALSARSSGDGEPAGAGVKLGAAGDTCAQMLGGCARQRLHSANTVC